MTLDERTPTSHGLKVVSAPSLVTDLTWVLSAATRPDWRPSFPFASELLEGREELNERIRTFWPDTKLATCFTEMQVLAHHAGALTETSADKVWSALAEAVATVPTDLGLESESPEDRQVFLHRLERLKESPELVASYIDLMREVWEPFDEIWQNARPALEESGRQVVQRLHDGHSLGDVVGESCATFQAMLGNITGRLQDGQPLLILPCLFFGKSLYLEFPGVTIVGSGFQRNDLGARLRTEAVARRLKTLADPTRLALLHFLSTMPSTVGDLAVSFDLAQPTVSMHIKMLREAGLVSSERQSGRMQLSADPNAVEALLRDLRAVV